LRWGEKNVEEKNMSLKEIIIVYGETINFDFKIMMMNTLLTLCLSSTSQTEVGSVMTIGCNRELFVFGIVMGIYYL